MIEHDKKLILLSNSSKRAAFTLERLRRYNIEPEWFHGAITSGEETCKALLAKPLGKRCVWLTWEEAETSFLSSCAVSAAGSIEEADFILVQGTQEIVYANNRRVPILFHSDQDWSMIVPLLERARARGLPLICANPDLVSVKHDGSIAHMPGKIATKYQEMGGQVQMYGKPQVEHFQACLERLGLNMNRVVHVGDSLHHDILGANQAKIDSIFVANGVHAEELGLNPIDGRADTLAADRLARILEAAGVTPTHTVTAFAW